MVGHRLRPPRISFERPGRDIQLLGQPMDERLDQLLQLSKRHARIAKQRELNGEANTIGVPTTRYHQVLVGTRQGEASRHAIEIERDAKKSLTLLIGQ